MSLNFLDILNKEQIIQDIELILNNSWLDIKRQINIFMVSVLSVLGWYYFSCLAINFYHTYIRRKEFEVLYPLQASFSFWRDKGFRFPYYIVHYMISGFGTHTCGFAAITLTCLFIVNTLHALALLKILHRLIDYSTTENVLRPERVKYILAWTRFYQSIYEFYSEINCLYYFQSAPLFLISVVVICLLIFQGSVGLGTNIKMVLEMILYLSAIFFQAFVYCINGQRLTSECEMLSVAIYNTKWYDEGREFKLIIRMMIMRTNRIFALQVGGFTTMCRVTFLEMLRSSFSFFLLLKEMSDK